MKSAIWGIENLENLGNGRELNPVQAEKGLIKGDHHGKKASHRPHGMLKSFIILHFNKHGDAHLYLLLIRCIL